MRLNLREIIENPGNGVAFDYAPDFSDVSLDGIDSIENTSAVGRVENAAGVLRLSGYLKAKLNCSCARCLRELKKPFDIKLSALITENLEDEDEDNPDIFPLEGDYIDLDEIAYTALVLNVEQRYLCSEDCKGLCPKCGKNLNDGPCDCTVETDPRMAVLAQLLENN